MENFENKQKVKAMLIFEMIGRPVEHLKETMEKFIDTVAAEKGIIVIKREVHEPKKLKQEDNDEKSLRFEGNPQLFSTFCELEVETQNIMGILSLVFKYMPSHLEIIEPHAFEMKNLDMGFVLNEILLKLHNYDSVAKSAIMQNQMLAEKLKEYMNNDESLGTDIRELAKKPLAEDKPKKGKKLSS